MKPKHVKVILVNNSVQMWWIEVQMYLEIMRTVQWYWFKQRLVVKTMVVFGKARLNVELVAVYQMGIVMGKLGSVSRLNLQTFKSSMKQET